MALDGGEDGRAGGPGFADLVGVGGQTGVGAQAGVGGRAGVGDSLGVGSTILPMVQAAAIVRRRQMMKGSASGVERR